MLASPYGSEMGTEFWEVVCDAHGIGGDGEYCGGNFGDNNTQFGGIIF
jgi:hypothetical protein